MGTVRRTTKQEQDAVVTNQMITNLMNGVASDRVALMEVVAGGPVSFRNTFLGDFRGLPVDSHIADRVFKFFCDQVVHLLGGESPAKAAGKWLDSYEPVSPPTQAEIDAAWRHDVASSEDGRRFNYLDGAGLAGDVKVVLHP